MPASPLAVDISEVVAQNAYALAAMPGARRRHCRRIAIAAEFETKDKTVPLDKGHLQGTVEADVDEDGGGCWLGAGGPSALGAVNVDYAVAQNFNLDYNHPNKGPTGERGAHYIERGFEKGLRAEEEASAHKMHEEIWEG